MVIDLRLLSLSYQQRSTRTSQTVKHTSLSPIYKCAVCAKKNKKTLALRPSQVNII